MREGLIVPLSRQAVEVLKNYSRPLAAVCIFSRAYKVRRPMSENTINGALRRLAMRV